LAGTQLDDDANKDTPALRAMADLRAFFEGAQVLDTTSNVVWVKR
jgi:hypothetical protein